jgi:hypothetical protein
MGAKSMKDSLDDSIEQANLKLFAYLLRHFFKDSFYRGGLCDMAEIFLNVTHDTKQII